MAGYSKSPRAVERMLPHLDQLQQGQTCAWNVPEGEADSFAYKVRNALYAARLYPERFPLLAQRSGQFKIRTASPSRVEAVLAPEPTEVEVQLLHAAPMHYTGGEPQRAAGPVSLDEVKARWEAQQPDPAPLFFQGAALGRDDLLALYNWSRNLHILMFLTPAGDLTLRRASEDLRGLEWTPADLEPEDAS